MVGGNLIEIAEVKAPDGKPALRLWVVGTKECERHDERAVLARPVDAKPTPRVGEEIWWHERDIFFRKDKHKLEKVSNSYDPTKVVAD